MKLVKRASHKCVDNDKWRGWENPTSNISQMESQEGRLSLTLLWCLHVKFVGSGYAPTTEFLGLGRVSPFSKTPWVVPRMCLLAIIIKAMRLRHLFCVDLDILGQRRVLNTIDILGQNRILNTIKLTNWISEHH